MKKSMLRFFATVLAISALLTALMGVALAESIYASGGDSYIRSTPSLSGTQIGTFPNGAVASYLGNSSVDSRGVTWYYISYNGKTGWVSSRYTTFSGSAPGYVVPGYVVPGYTVPGYSVPSYSGGTVYGSGGDSYIRSTPSLSGTQVGTFPDGAVASYLGNSSVDSRGVTWYYISYNGKTGWVSSRYTTLSGGTSGYVVPGYVVPGYSVPSYSAPSYSSGTVYGSGGDSYIRSTPSLSGTQIGTFPNGAAASYLGNSSVDSRGVTWYYISYNGKTGWVSSRYTYLG